MEITLKDVDVKKLVDAAIQKAVIEALGADKDALIGKLVGQALSMKVNSYDKSTIFESEVHKMIREAAQETFKEWLAANRERVKTAVRAHISGKISDDKAFAARISERLIEGMANSFYVTCTMRVED